MVLTYLSPEASVDLTFPLWGPWTPIYLKTVRTGEEVWACVMGCLPALRKWLPWPALGLHVLMLMKKGLVETSLKEPKHILEHGFERAWISPSKSYMTKMNFPRIILLVLGSAWVWTPLSCHSTVWWSLLMKNDTAPLLSKLCTMTYQNSLSLKSLFMLSLHKITITEKMEAQPCAPYMPTWEPCRHLVLNTG